MAVDIQALKQKQAAGIVAGVVPKSGPPALRIELDDFIQDTELANLYFLALEAFMSSEVSVNAFSYYEISGIHGQPKRAWDGVSSVNFGSTKPSPFGTRADGYCTHGSVLFPTWHRAYVAQFEQALFLHAAEIATALNVLPVLDRFRVPYWDPFLPRQRSANGTSYTYGIPIILTLPQILVRRPATPTQWTPMNNPLYKFKFPADKKTPSIDWTTYATGTAVTNAVKVNTIRGYDGSSPNANHTYVIKTFDDSFNPTTTTTINSDEAGRLWRVMFDNKSYEFVSNHTVLSNRLGQPNPQTDYNQNSIEGFHDDIHGYLGKGPNSDDKTYPFGHMGYPSFAAFDPTFWLHHANIDRIFAIWQGIHSNDAQSQQWWTSLDNRDGTFVEPVGVAETPTSPLAPFRKAVNGTTVTWWNSNDVRDTRVLGYDYPQVAKARTSGSMINSLRAWANAELGWADPNNFKVKGPDQSALTNFVTKQIPAKIASFPAQIKVDGTASLPTGTSYISSGSTTTKTTTKSSAKQNGTAATTTTTTTTQTSSATTTTNGDATVASAVAEDTVISNGDTTQRVLQDAIPESMSTFEERFGGLGKLVSKDRKMTQWNASFSIEKYCLDGPFLIHFFLGDFSTAADAVWLHDPNRAGTSSIFANSQADIDSGACENCATKQASGFKYYDTVGLTHGLVNKIRAGREEHGVGIADLTADAVVPYLIRNLHWRIVDSHGQDVPRQTLTSLKIGVYSETVTLPEQLTDLPLFDDKEMHYRVTQGRPGGLNDGEMF